MYSCNIVSIDANVGHPGGDISYYSDTVGECKGHHTRGNFVACNSCNKVVAAL